MAPDLRDVERRDRLLTANACWSLVDSAVRPNSGLSLRVHKRQQPLQGSPRFRTLIASPVSVQMQYAERMNKEQEAIGLCVATEAIDDIVNHLLFDMRDVRHAPGEAELLFETSVHKDMFLVRLLDFVHEAGDRALNGAKASCLGVLKNAASEPAFDLNGSSAELAKAVAELEGWLNRKPTVRLWLPTLNLQATLTVSNLELIKISGNHSKHNLARLTAVSRLVARILKGHQYEVDEEMLPLALDDFRDHLGDNYFIYYSTWLAELLNNVRWGIQTYLRPTYDAVYRTEPDGMYRYEYPTEIVNKIPRMWFWRLMNNVRRPPNLKRFKGSRSLKSESSLEGAD